MVCVCSEHGGHSEESGLGMLSLVSHTVTRIICVLRLTEIPIRPEELASPFDLNILWLAEAHRADYLLSRACYSASRGSFRIPHEGHSDSADR